MIYGQQVGFPSRSDWLVGSGFQQVDLPLQIIVGRISCRYKRTGCSSGHVEVLLNAAELVRDIVHHHVLRHLRLHCWRLEDGTSPYRCRHRRALCLHSLHGTGLHESAVSHLDTGQFILRIGIVVGSHVHGWHRCHHRSWCIIELLVRQARHKPRILHVVGSGVGSKLLHVSISKGSLVALRVLDQLPLPLSTLKGLVLHVSLWTECLQRCVALQPRGVSQGPGGAGRLVGGIQGLLDTKVLVPPDSLDSVPAAQLHVGHPAVVHCHVGFVQI